MTMVIKVLLVIMLLSVGCRVQIPKSKGFVLTPSGMVHKSLLTKKEKKKYRMWLREEKSKLKTIKK